jgi:hypothetical protein
MNIDTLVESFYSKKDETESLINEVLSLLITEQEQDVSPSAARRGEERVLRLPVAFPTEISVGQTPTSEDREMFELWMSRIPGSDLSSKVQAIEKFIEDPPETNVSETLSFLMFLNTFAFILKEFNASVAGFMWEPFLAALIGGEASVQVPTSEHDIADVKLAGERFSLKILREDGAVGGSFVDLVKHFQANPDEPMTYYVIKKVGSKMVFYEFSISKETLFDFIGHPQTEKVLKPQITSVTPPEDTSVGKLKSAVKAKLPRGYKVEKITLPDSEDALRGKVKAGEKYDAHIGVPTAVAGKAGKGAKLTANAKHLWGSQESYEKFYAAQNDPDFWQKVEKLAPGFKNKQQFEIGWNYAKANQHVKVLGTIDISKETMDRAFAKGASLIGQDLTALFNSMTDLVDNVGKFFLMDCEGGKCTPDDLNARGSAGKEALEDATVVKRVVDAKIAPQLK